MYATLVTVGGQDGETPRVCGPYLPAGRHVDLGARVVLPNQLFAEAGVDLTVIGYLEMDFAILARTVGVVLRHDDISRDDGGGEDMPEFMGDGSAPPSAADG